MSGTAALAGVPYGQLNWLAEAAYPSGSAMTDECETASSEDASDIRATLGGDEEAYARIVRRYQPLVYRQMYRFTRDQSVLDELVQEVFVEAYYSLKGYRGTAPFLHWLRRVATRAGYRYWKRSERRRRIETAARETAYLDDGAAYSTPSDAGEIVFRYLARLAPADRLVLTLMYLEQLGTDEIAAQTGWSRTLVRVRAHRARNRLKRMLNDEGVEL